MQVIKASAKDTSVAVANVVAFGTLGMLCLPYAAHALLASPEQSGLFLGTAVHDTSQVLGSAMTYRQVFDAEEVLKVAAVTKLTRNLFLAGVVPGAAWQYREGASEDYSAPVSPLPATEFGLATFQKFVPGFVVAFVGAAALRSAGDLALQGGSTIAGVDAASFEAAANWIASTGSTVGLGMAMSAVGLRTSATALRGVGPRPFLVGGSGALVVGGTGFTMIKVLEYAGSFP